MTECSHVTPDDATAHCVRIPWDNHMRFDSPRPTFYSHSLFHVLFPPLALTHGDRRD